MYAIYRELHPPTGVEHCVECHFFNQNSKSLVVAAASVLRVYNLCNVEPGRSHNEEGEKVSPYHRLLQVEEYTLYGCVQSLDKVQLSQSKRETLLLTFMDSKLSAVEWDPDTNQLKTVSLHFFEDDDLRGGLLHNTHHPLLRVDPEGRCAAMMVYGSHLAIIPFKTDALLEDHEGLVTSHTQSIQPSYTICLQELTEPVVNVKDFNFLHGYNTPTLFILYEPTPTWAGRISLRKDTSCIAAISLNLSEKSQRVPVIWHAQSLPFDCCYTVPVPMPIGGMLVIGANAVLYLNQSSPTVGLSLNSLSDSSTNFPLQKPSENIAVTMDCSHATFITPEQLVVSLKGGEIYLLTLIPDGMKGIRNILFEKAAAAVLTSCICAVGSQYIFLGSRLGNSLLLKYSTKNRNGDLEPPAKRIKSEEVPSAGEDAEELEVYGADTTTGPLIASYKFEVCDSILNIGPVTGATLGAPDFISEEFVDKSGTDLELVTCSGYGKNGALCVLQRGIRPHVVTTFELPGCTDMWTVFSTCPSQSSKKADERGGGGGGGDSADEREKEAEVSRESQEGTEGGETEKDGEGGEGGGGGRGEGEHSYLLLSRSDSTMVLQTGQEIAELDSSGFATQAPTVFAGNMGEGQYIVQVTATDVRLLKDVSQISRILLDMSGGVRACTLCDPYAVILFVDGAVALLELQRSKEMGAMEEGEGRREQGREREEEEEGEESVELKLIWPEIKGSKVALISSYTDYSGLFTTDVLKEEGSPDHTHPTTPTSAAAAPREPKSLADEEDELLYGNIDTIGKSTLASSSPAQPPPPHPHTKDEGKERKEEEEEEEEEEYVPTHWCVLYREDGSMELYSVPEFSLVFSVRNFSSAPTTLKDSGMLPQQSSNPGPTGSAGQSKPLVPLGCVEEILLLEVGSQGAGSSIQPYLLALLDHELVVYRAFRYRQTLNTGHLQLRFSKVTHNVILHDHKQHKLAKQLSRQDPEEEEAKTKFIPRLRVFSNIAGYTGVFVCGPYTHWIFLSGRGGMYIHPMYIDGPVTCFAPFHNVNCPHGFLYFNAEGELRISVLPSHLSYDSHWPVRKVPIRSTPHFISYHTKSKVHALVTSELVPVTEVPCFDDNLEEVEELERDPLFVPPMEKHFFLQLFSPSLWEAVPNTKQPLELYEHVTIMKVMLLRSLETVSGRKEFIVMGTSTVCGEEVCSKGKILIFDVLDVIPEPGKPLTKNKLKCLYNQEQKGIVSALEAVDGLLLSCMGQKIFMWQFKDCKDLVGVAFIDTDLYIHQAQSLKSFIVIADIQHSIQLLKYQENRKTLYLVSQDQYPADIYSCDFIIDGSQFAIVASDSNKNFVLYQYQPEVPESNGGRYLIRQGDINVGSHVNTTFRLRCRSSAPIGAPLEMQVLLQDKRHTTYFASLDGSLGYLLPLPEVTFRRLKMLQIKLVQGLPHNAGLNPKSFRMFHSHHQYLYTPQHKVLDGQLLWRYSHLSQKERADFAKQIGTSVGQILEDLKEIDKISAHF